MRFGDQQRVPIEPSARVALAGSRVDRAFNSKERHEPRGRAVIERGSTVMRRAFRRPRAQQAQGEHDTDHSQPTAPPSAERAGSTGVGGRTGHAQA